jgi:predicted glycogen debranching enzyme
MMPEFVRFGRAICGDLQQAERREWWLANGRGGYAGGTIAGSLTRRYHGLLIAPVEPPLGRRLVWAKADAELSDGEQRWPLFTNRWAGGAISPAGHVHIESFHLDGGIPVWLFAIGLLRIEARIWLEPGADTTYVAWRLLPGPEPESRKLSLRVRLIVNDRDHHGQTAAGQFAAVVDADEAGLRVRRPDFALTFRACGGVIAPTEQWIENFDLPAERERGLSDRDNHLQIAEARLDLHPGKWAGIVGSLQADPSPDLAAALERRRQWQQSVLDQAAQVSEMASPPDWIAQLLLAADSFVFARPLSDRSEGRSVIAGYPWFGDWGRDTMISLPGLTLATGRQQWARDILLTFARFVDRGMLPNVFPGVGDKPDYNTADASLWFFEAWRAYVEESSDRATLAQVFPALSDIVEWHRRGTRYGICMDPRDGLLSAGRPGVQLTWMDAKLGDWVVTPRIGKPVEINALWYNALRLLADWLREAQDPEAEVLAAHADKTRASFNRRFWHAAGGHLYDVVDGENGDDAAFRPNQIFAIALEYPVLDQEYWETVVTAVQAKLLTPVGLRSLAPDEPDYKPRYFGDLRARDAAYHQGTVWAWLIGPFTDAWLKVYPDDRAEARQLLDGFELHLAEAGIGSISEVFDAEPPFTPRGCIAQAWSVAEVLRCLAKTAVGR